MAPGVIPEAMSGHRDRGDQIRILGSSVANTEESRWNSPLFQNLEDLRGDFCVRAIIEGQGHPV
jgi:hypothetical protein